MEATGVTTATTPEEQARRLLFEGRYVDDKGKPLPYESEFPYAKHPYAEFKMMPIRMNLVMDQRRLPKLLVECANSNMPIEVRRIRITKSQGSVLDLASATSAPTTGAAGPPGGGMGGMGGMMAPRSRAPTGPSRFGPTTGGTRASSDKQELGPYDIPVEIHGVIYIYNPPDREKLGTGAAAGEKPSEAGAPATPASETPAPAKAAAPAAAPDVPKGGQPVAPAAAPVAPARAPAKSPNP